MRQIVVVYDDNCRLPQSDAVSVCNFVSFAISHPNEKRDSLIDSHLDLRLRHVSKLEARARNCKLAFLVDLKSCGDIPRLRTCEKCAAARFTEKTRRSVPSQARGSGCQSPLLCLMLEDPLPGIRIRGYPDD